MAMKTVRMGMLFDFYGTLLTERQRDFFSQYYNDDLSLGEIADHYGITRQAVYDTLKRSEEALESYETRLRLIQHFEDQKSRLARIDRDVQAAIKMLPPTDGPIKSLLAKVRAALMALDQ